MSLGKLLTTGKSLVGLTNSNSRYHLQKGALPKFESAKNPFVSKANAEMPEREPQLPKLTPEEVAAANLKETQAMPAPAEPAAANRDAKPAEPAKPAPVVDSWLKKINSLVWFGKSKPAESKPAAPRFAKSTTPVQGELSLDNIKVMRNDLSDTDVEVVPVKSRPAKVVAPAPTQASAAAMAIPDLPPATRAWEFLGEHLLKKD